MFLSVLQNPPQENELLTTKTLRLEDNIEDLKSKLSNALAEKDRLVQVLLEFSDTLCYCLNILYNSVLLTTIQDIIFNR